MKYIIQVNNEIYVCLEQRDARLLFDALMSAKLVDTNWKRNENEKLTIRNDYRIEYREVEDSQVITGRESVIILAPEINPADDLKYLESLNPVDSVDTSDKSFKCACSPGPMHSDNCKAADDIL